jgi:hypothetical protein
MRWRAAAGVGCVVLAALAALLARDVWRIDKALRDGDVRAAATSADPRLWEAAETLPLGLAERLLASGDDVDNRVLVARATRLAQEEAQTPLQARRRTPVEAALGRVEQGDPEPRRASQAALLLGVLVFTDPEDPSRRTETPTDKAAARFRSAVLLDPGNDVAKRNLELMLQQDRSQNRRGPSGRGGGNRPGVGGAGLAPPGGGY